MPRPVTVHKGGQSVPNVYPSELNHWLSEGWTLEPTAIPSPPVQAPLVVEHSRQAELEAMTWREIKAIATSMGIENPDSQPWESFIPEILKAEE